MTKQPLVLQQGCSPARTAGWPGGGHR